MLIRSAEIPNQLKVLQSALWLMASEFQCGITTTARRVRFFSGAGNQRALARLFSGYGVFIGEVKRKNSACCLRYLASFCGLLRVANSSTCRRSKRKSRGVSYQKN